MSESKKKFRMPGSLKRMLTLMSTGDAHRDGEVRRTMVSAHQHMLDVRDRRSKSLGPTANVAEEAAETVTT